MAGVLAFASSVQPTRAPFALCSLDCCRAAGGAPVRVLVCGQVSSRGHCLCQEPAAEPRRAGYVMAAPWRAGELSCPHINICTSCFLRRAGAFFARAMLKKEIEREVDVRVATGDNDREVKFLLHFL